MFKDLIVRIARALKKSSLPYMIIGGQAVLLYGTPRMTNAIDITLGINVDELEIVLGVVKEVSLHVLPEDFKTFVEKTLVLPTKDSNTGIRVDFIFSFSSYERQAIQRARSVSFEDGVVMFASVEDLIIHKIFAGRPRDLEDVHSIIMKNPDFDREYTRKWLKEFDRSMESSNFTRLFERLVREAE